MKMTRLIMGMPISLEIVGESSHEPFDQVFDYFTAIDKRFSTYKDDSEISRINAGKLTPQGYSPEMKTILSLSDETKKQTDGFFNIQQPDGKLDPSGIVKGWAILNAAKILKDEGFKNFYIEAGGDIQVNGKNSQGKDWRVGIRHPFKSREIVKVLVLGNKEGVATSGTYERGEHVYNPKNGSKVREVVSLTVIGPNIYEADRFATAAFAMGRSGIEFIEKLPGYEGYMIDKSGTATLTHGFNSYTDD